MPMVIGLDIAKRIFQLHSGDPETGEIQRSKLQRAPAGALREPSGFDCGHRVVQQFSALGAPIREHGA
jgi:hypothetical protein